MNTGSAKLQYRPILFTTYDMDWYGLKHIRGAMQAYISVPSPVCMQKKCYAFHLFGKVPIFGGRHTRYAYRYLDLSFELIHSQLSWNTAEKKCADENSHLVSLNSFEEIRFLFDVLRFSYHYEQYVFIGLTRKTVSDVSLPNIISHVY